MMRSCARAVSAAQLSMRKPSASNTARIRNGENTGRGAEMSSTTSTPAG